MWLQIQVKFKNFFHHFLVKRQPCLGQDADTFQLMRQCKSLSPCVDVDTAVKENCSRLQNKQKGWFTLGVGDVLFNCKDHGLLTSRSAHPDSRRPPGFCWPLAWDHTRFKHHVLPAASMSWPWPPGKTLFSTLLLSCTLAVSTPPPTPNFTLHFTADIISQISAHLVRILTDFDGLRDENQPLLLQSTVLSNISWLIRKLLPRFNSSLLVFLLGSNPNYYHSQTDITNKPNENVTHKVFLW